jgi:hypothetical protein
MYTGNDVYTVIIFVSWEFYSLLDKNFKRHTKAVYVCNAKCKKWKLFGIRSVHSSRSGELGRCVTCKTGERDRPVKEQNWSEALQCVHPLTSDLELTGRDKTF